MTMIRFCLVGGLFGSPVVEGWSIGSSRIVISKDDLKSSQPMVTRDTLDWIPWHQGEVDTEIDSAGTLDQYIESEYRAWLEQYNKRGDEAHFATFKQNYLKLLEEAEDGHGGQPFFQLNQFGDMTQKEHQREMIMLEAYYDWCREYGKRQDPMKFEFFKANLLEEVQRCGSIEEEIHLGEFADRRDNLEFFMEPVVEETSQHLLSNSQRLQHHEPIGFGVFVESNTMLPEDQSVAMPNYLETMQGRRERQDNRYSSNLHP